MFYLMARGIPADRGRGAADPGLRRRGDRGHRACGPARRADGAGRRLAQGARELTHASGGEQRRLRRRPHPRGFPDPRRCRSTASRWSISTTPPRRRSRKAVLDRIQQAYTSRIRQRASRPALSRQCRDRRLRGRAREGARRSSTPRAPEEIIFTRNATEAINLVAYTFGRERIKPGDEIVLSIMEHHSNIVPWHFLRERQGAVIKWAPVDDEGNFLIDEFEKLLTPRTKMVAITHMSNMLGTLVPVKEVVQLAHARGIPVLVDGAQARGASRRRRAGHRLRFLCLHRPQALRPDRHRRALRQIRAARRHAAVQRRRRDDPRGVRGPHHLRRAAAPVRGRHAADRAGDRARRRDRLRQFDRQGAHPRARGRPSRPTPTSGCARSTRCASSAPPRTRARSSRSR